MKKGKKILLAACTHGDEEIGVSAVKHLKRTTFASEFDFLLANPLARSKRVRFVDADLNRCAPGNLESEKYEERRAAEILAFVRKREYQYHLDLHGAISKACGIFAIIANPTRENLLLASWLDVKNIIIWPSRKEILTGPWTRFVGTAVGIECGDKDSRVTEKALERLLIIFLRKFRHGELVSDLESNLAMKNLFVVIGKIEDLEYKDRLVDFQLAQYKGQDFYPILVGQYPGINCYKMKKISVVDDALDPWDLLTKGD